MVFVQLLLNSIIIGSIYALVASGFSLIYSTNRIMHFAHGASVIASAYFLFLLFTKNQINFTLACILTIIFAGLLGYIMYRLIYVPLKNRKSSNVILLMASVAVLILIENLILLLFGADVKTINLIQVSEGLNFLGARITELQIIIIIVSIIILIGLYILMKKTTIGKHMRAVADNEQLANIMGISTKKIASFSFIIGSALAGIAGILIALEQNLEPSMGVGLMIKGFAGAIIGGVTSVPASVAGSYLLGFAENFGIWYLPSGYKDAIAFILLFLFLLFKPTGIFGINKGIKK